MLAALQFKCHSGDRRFVGHVWLTRLHHSFAGLLQKKHPAEHPVQEVSEDRELHHRAHQPQPLPTVPLQEVFIRGHVQRR